VPKAASALACGLAVLGGAGVAGCSKTAALPDVCRSSDASALRSALRRAPRTVRLPGGVAVSQCVAGSRTDAELQVVGGIVTETGDRLVRRATRDPEAALELGYLEGATERGASRNNGIGAELGNRMANLFTPADSTPAGRAAYERGRAAGRSTG
jgi:hypothetical protein